MKWNIFKSGVLAALIAVGSAGQAKAEDALGVILGVTALGVIIHEILRDDDNNDRDSKRVITVPNERKICRRQIVNRPNHQVIRLYNCRGELVAQRVVRK